MRAGIKAAICVGLMAATPVWAEAGLGPVSGNWAGPSGDGGFFIANLEQEPETVRLRIWNAANAEAMTTDDPALDVGGFALSAFVVEGGQRLEVLTSEAAIGKGFGSGSILQVVTEFADEVAEGVSIVQIQEVDGTLLVTGYYHRSESYTDAAPLVFECAVDVWNGTVSVDGTEQALPPLDYEAMSASDWTFGAAFDRGWCPSD